MTLGKIIGGFFAFILVVIMLTIGVYVVIGVLCVKGCQAVVQGDGIKGVASKVWNGTNEPPQTESPYTNAMDVGAFPPK